MKQALVLLVTVMVVVTSAQFCDDEKKDLGACAREYGHTVQLDLGDAKVTNTISRAMNESQPCYQCGQPCGAYCCYAGQYCCTYQGACYCCT
ncbi:hypothetical protein HDE_10742 [Halotydeus destructor]|nr:hypothetical protein HDE_10742 [Halotydeus destructor]